MVRSHTHINRIEMARTCNTIEYIMDWPLEWAGCANRKVHFSLIAVVCLDRVSLSLFLFQYIHRSIIGNYYYSCCWWYVVQQKLQDTRNKSSIEWHSVWGMWEIALLWCDGVSASLTHSHLSTWRSLDGTYTEIIEWELNLVLSYTRSSTSCIFMSFEKFLYLDIRYVQRMARRW